MSYHLGGSALDRREFIRRALLAGTATGLAFSAPRIARAKPSGDKLRLGVVGVGGRGRDNLDGVASQEIIALCDIDQERLAAAAKDFPRAKTYSDFRRLLDAEKLDGLVVGTPDHTHAMPVVWALERGLDVYCEKPLAHSVYEVRKMRDAAGRKQAVTQMGTQIHAGDNYRRVVELVRAGAVGPVERVHVWLDGGIRPGKRATSGMPPATVDYDLWTGPAPLRPFSTDHFHFNWRYWFDYGNGVLGDFGCHYMDLPFWALDLRYPTHVAAKGELSSSAENDVPVDMQVDYQFPARGDLPPVHLTWYHGRWRPEGAEAYQKGSAVLFEGPRGKLLADYGSRKLFLEPAVDAPTPEPTIANSIGHHEEWIEACKTRGPTTCNFDYSGALAEAVLLGNVSYRLGGAPLDWDGEALRATNAPEADPYIRRAYREGWTLEG